MMKLLRTDWPVALTEVLERQLVEGAETVGQLVDILTDRGDAIGVDSDGRLAIQEAALGRLEAEYDERERIRQEKLEAEENARLARLEEQAKRQEATEAERERRRAYQERVSFLEKATGVPLHQLELELRKTYTHARNTGMSFADREALENRNFTLAEIEEWVAREYGHRYEEENV